MWEDWIPFKRIRLAVNHTLGYIVLLTAFRVCRWFTEWFSPKEWHDAIAQVENVLLLMVLAVLALEFIFLMSLTAYQTIKREQNGEA